MRSKGSVNSPISLSNEKANDFSKHFANVGSKIAADIVADNNRPPIPPRPPCVTTAGLTHRVVTLPELSTALSELSGSQAVGLDDLPIAAIRKSFSVIGPHILHLVNSSISTRVFFHQHGKRRAWCQYLNPDLVKKLTISDQYPFYQCFQKFAKRLCVVRSLNMLSVTIYWPLHSMPTENKTSFHGRRSHQCCRVN